MLSINATNKYGSHQYIEDTTGTVNITSLDNNDYWSIKNPSEDIQSLGIGKLRKYNDTNYLLSDKAYNYMYEHTESYGATCALSFQDPTTDKEYFLIVGDDKRYLMNCGGGFKLGETSEDTVVREVWEELKINMTPYDLKPVSKVTTGFRDVLVDADFVCTTRCFYARPDYYSLSHLITSSIDPDSAYTVFKAEDCKYSLDETQIIVVIDRERLEEVPFVIEGKSFDGHHRKILYHLQGIPNDIDCSYLQSIDFF